MIGLLFSAVVRGYVLLPLIVVACLLHGFSERAGDAFERGVIRPVDRFLRRRLARFLPEEE